MSFIVPYDRLDIYQRNIINSILSSNDKISFISGFAGSGKTLLLVFLAKLYIAKASNRNSCVCIVTFTRALLNMISNSLTEEDKKRIFVQTIYEFKNDKYLYRMIAVDEVQDLTENEFRTVCSKAIDKIVVAGDINQQIYVNKISGKFLQEFITNSNFYTLKIVYRMTKKLKKIADVINPKSNILLSSEFDKKEARQGGSEVFYYTAKTIDEEVAWVLKKSNRLRSPKSPCAILLPSHRSIRIFYEVYFRLNNIQFTFDTDPSQKLDYCELNKNNYKNLNIFYYGNGIGSIAESDSCSVTYLMTYHSVKGLDFESIFIPFLDKEIYSIVMRSYSKKGMNLDKRISYVAFTRSHSNLFLSHHSAPDPILEYLKKKNLILELVDQESFSTADSFDTDDDLF